MLLNDSAKWTPDVGVAIVGVPASNAKDVQHNCPGGCSKKKQEKRRKS